jgi:hypothetical protein
MPRPQHASRPVPPVLSYAGIWSGRSIRRTCVESGGAIGVGCRFVPDRNPLLLHISQTASDVRAVLRIGRQRVRLTGRLRPEGRLRLRGSGGSAAYTITVRDWHSTLDRGRISGTFSYVIMAADERLGSVTVTSVLDGLTPAASST